MPSATADAAAAAAPAENTVLARMQKALDERQKRGVLRTLSSRVGADKKLLVDFCSNDYLGLSRDRELRRLIEEECKLAEDIVGADNDAAVIGSGGSRLLSGNNLYIESLERDLAALHKREGCLLFNSGYTANLSMVSCMATGADVILYDELSHNSLREGLKLGRQRRADAFKHNSIEHLRSLVSEVLAEETEEDAKAATNIFVVVESVYSMDGDVGPLREFLDLCEEMSVRPGQICLVVDEAHGTGVFGPRGLGVVEGLGLEGHPSLLCTIHTYGKAYGVHGAAIMGSAVLVSYLLNYARPLIFTTAMPLHSLVSIKCAYTVSLQSTAKRAHLRSLIKLFTRLMPAEDLIASPSAIQACLLPGNERVLKATALLRAEGLDCLAIRAPTVPRGTERIRIILHAHNTEDEVLRLVEQLKTIKARNAAEDKDAKL